jgi:hypothetical protein
MTFTHQDLVTLTDWMADDGGYTAREIADAVAKPWKFADELAQAKLLNAVMTP